MAQEPPARQNSDFVAKFLQTVRGTVPLAIEQIDMMLGLIAAARGEKVRTFLDLGCGEGVLAAAILNEHPTAHGVLVDLSESVLDAARRHLQVHRDRVTFITADFHEPGWVQRIAAQSPLDVIVSSFSIHHFPAERKRVLYREIYDLLSVDGIFLNIEHVYSATRWTESTLDDYMIDAIFGEELKTSPGRKRAEIAREYYERASQAKASFAPLEVQLDWLREIGFADVECFLKVQELAVFGGQKPAA